MGGKLWWSAIAHAHEIQKEVLMILFKVWSPFRSVGISWPKLRLGKQSVV